MNKTWQATLLIASSALCFGAIPIFTLIATRSGATLEGMLVIRYIIATLGLVVVAGGIGSLAIPRNTVVSLLAMGGVGQALLTFCALSALRYLPAATVSFIFYTYPVWVTVIETATGAERLTTTRVIALLLAIAGLAVMIGSPFSGHMSLLGLSLCLGAAVVYAIYIPLIGKLQAGVAPAVASAWVTIGAAVLFAALGLVRHTIVAPGSLAGWSAVVAMALFSTVAGFILFLRGLAVLGPVRTAIVSTVEPFFTAILAALLVQQPLAARTFTGGVLITASFVLISKTKSETSS
jgi:drug/metabolite transporter (DMT)-like permease